MSHFLSLFITVSHMGKMAIMALISLCFKQEPFFSALCIIYMPAPRENAFASIRLGFFVDKGRTLCG